MFGLLTFLDDFRGAKVSCRRGPELSSEQRLELFEVSLGLTSEEVIGSVFKVVDIIKHTMIRVFCFFNNNGCI